MAVYIAWIIYAGPLSLILESISLFSLSIFALFLDISAGNYASGDPFSNSFKTRPGVSSGIFLGAMTLPGLMLSKLIQMSRGLSLSEVGVLEFENLRLLYWATSICCFSMLVFLRCIFPQNTVGSTRNWSTRISLSCIASYVAVFCALSYSTSHSGWFITITLLWVVIHGLAATRLIQKILQTFPACASIGEALLVSAGLVIYFGDMIAYTMAKVSGYIASPALFDFLFQTKRSEISTINQGFTLGLLVFPVVLKFVFQVSVHFKLVDSSSKMASNEIKKSCVFYVLLALMLLLVVPAWMQFVQDFEIHPLLWVFNFVSSEPLKRLSLCTYWMVLIFASVTKFYYISKDCKVERILLRKYYHLMAVAMFVPALLFQPKFLDLAFGAALAVFLILEIIRVWRIWPFGSLVHQFMNAFTDHRDSEMLIVSHFSLLLGCALPIWLSSGFNDRQLAPFAGILSLGIGDTMASMIGYKYGVLRWSKTGKKTIEGTAAGITSVLAACLVLLPLLALTTGYILTWNWISLFVAVTASGLLEAYTTQLDNAFIPLVFYSLLCL